MPSINVALATNGGVATASSQISTAFPVTAVNDGGRMGKNWGKGGADSGWNDATNNVWPDWVQITFNGQKNISEIDVYTLSDTYATRTADPTLTETFSGEGITDFDVQYWNGAAWVSVVTGAVNPTAATVTGNRNVWRQFTFTPVTTTQIRVVVYAGLFADALYKYSRIVEIEAYTAAVKGLSRSRTVYGLGGASRGRMA